MEDFCGGHRRRPSFSSSSASRPPSQKRGGHQPPRQCALKCVCVERTVPPQQCRPEIEERLALPKSAALAQGQPAHLHDHRRLHNSADEPRRRDFHSLPRSLNTRDHSLHHHRQNDNLVDVLSPWKIGMLGHLFDRREKLPSLPQFEAEEPVVAPPQAAESRLPGSTFSLIF